MIEGIKKSFDRHQEDFKRHIQERYETMSKVVEAAEEFWKGSGYDPQDMGFSFSNDEMYSEILYKNKEIYVTIDLHSHGFVKFLPIDDDENCNTFDVALMVYYSAEESDDLTPFAKMAMTYDITNGEFFGPIGEINSPEKLEETGDPNLSPANINKFFNTIRNLFPGRKAIYQSDREIDLVSDFSIVNKFPCATVEKWNKWYSIFLVTEDGKVLNIEHEVYRDGEPSEPSIFTPEFKNTWYRCVEAGDHCWSPVHVLSVFAYFGIYMGEEAYKALVMMWAEQHVEEPGWEYAWLPTKELYNKVIVPDGGDISNCNSFSEEERKQFKFYREDTIYSLKDDFMFNESCRKKVDKKRYTGAEFVDKSSEIEIRTGEPPIKKGVTIKGRYGGKSVLNQILPDERIPSPEISPKVIGIAQWSPSEQEELKKFVAALKTLGEKYNIPIVTAKQNPDESQPDSPKFDMASVAGSNTVPDPLTVLHMRYLYKRPEIYGAFNRMHEYASESKESDASIKGILKEVCMDRNTAKHLLFNNPSDPKDFEKLKLPGAPFEDIVWKLSVEEWALNMFDQLPEDDVEVSHSRADNILVQLLSMLGLKRIAKRFEDLDKWYT